MVPLSQDDLKRMAEKLDSANKKTNVVPMQPSIFSSGNFGVPFAHQNVDAAEIADALRFISADVQRGNGKIFDGNGQPLPDWAWSPPKGSDGISDTQLIAIQNAIAAGPVRHSIQSPDWAGRPVAEVLGLDIEKHRLRITSILKAMTARGLLQIVERKDGRSTSRKFYEVGAHPATSPPAQGG